MIPEYQKCEESLRQLELAYKYGSFGVAAVGDELVARSFVGKLCAHISYLYAVMRNIPTSDLNRTNTLINRKVQEIIDFRATVNADSDTKILKTYYKIVEFAKKWNSNVSRGIDLIPFGPFAPFQRRMQNGYAFPVHEPLLADKFDTYIVNAERLPLTVVPKGTNSSTYVDLLDWVESHRKEMKELLDKYGAIRFRGFTMSRVSQQGKMVPNPVAFKKILSGIFGNPPQNYIGGDGSRNRIIEGVYTSTEAPGFAHIPLHNERANIPVESDSIPRYICFFSQIAAKRGTGQTTLGWTQKITDAVRTRFPQLWAMQDKTVIYEANLPPSGNLRTFINRTHKTWPQSFETENKEEAEKKLSALKGVKSYQWSGNWFTGPWLTIRREAPMTLKNPRDENQRLWTNQTHLYDQNPRLRGGWFNHFFANLLYYRKDTLQADYKFTDGFPKLSSEQIYDIYDVHEEFTADSDWKAGDIMIVDNFMVKHGRRPYQGDRLTLTSLVSDFAISQ